MSKKILLRRNHYQAIVFSGLIFTVLSCTQENDNGKIFFPDFSICDCSVVYQPVCGADGRNYLNDCYAFCLDVDIESDTLCGPDTYVPGDTMTWPIQQVCIPVIRLESPQEIRLFSDGTVLYQNQDGTYFRGTQNFCRCLPPWTMISTPTGELRISSLVKGDTVWTISANGPRTAAALSKVQKTPVGKFHKLIRMELEDGRHLEVSPLHPDIYGEPLGNLKIGNCYDNSIITSITHIPFVSGATWDILPEGEAGSYFANGIIVGSTLKSSTVQ